jgi:hypothetical protein
MRKVASASLLAVVLILILAPPSLAGGRHHHHHHGSVRFFVGAGPGWWGPYPFGFYPYYPYYPYYYTPPVVVREPSVYVQQQPASAAPAEPSEPVAGYWYYCPSAREYYPTAPSCPEAWIKVPPRQE